MSRRALPARYTIERRSAPLSRRRFLSTEDDGVKCWSDTIDTFPSKEAATSFIKHRMGRHAADTMVISHTLQ